MLLLGKLQVWVEFKNFHQCSKSFGPPVPYPQYLVFIFFPLFQIKAFLLKEKRQGLGNDEYWRLIHVLKQKWLFLIHGFWKIIYDGSSTRGKRWTQRRKSVLFFWSVLIVFSHLRNALVLKMLPAGAGWTDASVSMSSLLLWPFQPSSKAACSSSYNIIQTATGLLVPKWLRIFFLTKPDHFRIKHVTGQYCFPSYSPEWGNPAKKIQWQI